MLGAIIGDIVGSIYEFNNIKTKNFPFFSERCFFTDDTVMTCAVAEAIMAGGSKDDFIDWMKYYGLLYPLAGYGGRFCWWLFDETREPYHSYGNGSAMRVSPCGWIGKVSDKVINYEELHKVQKMAKLSSEVTHNHPEGVKGALATADAIFLARTYFNGQRHSKEEEEQYKQIIKDYIEKEYGYDLSFKLDDIRSTYRFNETCQGTVPQAIVAFLESNDFGDAIRNAISIGGDSDTLGAITGSIAEAAYGISDTIRDKVYTFLDDRLKDVLKRWEKYTKSIGIN